MTYKIDQQYKTYLLRLMEKKSGAFKWVIVWYVAAVVCAPVPIIYCLFWAFTSAGSLFDKFMNVFLALILVMFVRILCKYVVALRAARKQIEWPYKHMESEKLIVTDSTIKFQYSTTDLKYFWQHDEYCINKADVLGMEYDETTHRVTIYGNGKLTTEFSPCEKRYVNKSHDPREFNDPMKFKFILAVADPESAMKEMINGMKNVKIMRS